MNENELIIKLPPEDSYGRIYVKNFLDKRLNTHDMVVYACLRSFGKTCHAGKSAMAERCRCSRRQVQKSLKVLEECGYIVRGEIVTTNRGIKQDIQVIAIELVKTPEYPGVGTECATPVQDIPTGREPSSHKADKLNIESKQITIERGELDAEAERLYKLYPNKTTQRKVVRKSREDIKTIKALLKQGYPLERAIRETVLIDDYPKDLCRFLQKKNLPDLDEIQRPDTARYTPTGDEIKCHHEMDWESPQLKDHGFGQFWGPCKHCGKGIMRAKEGLF